MTAKKSLSHQQKELLEIVRTRFEKNNKRHKGIEWKKVQERLEANLKKFLTIAKMEETGGEPDVIGYDKKTGEYIFCDCSEESPKGRRSFCYDREALDARKEHKPKNCVTDLAKEIGIEILNEEQYRELQTMGEFDLKTSSWIKTPNTIRELGGALFCDRRFDHVFTYHNGAESYYAGRAFRGILKV